MTDFRYGYSKVSDGNMSVSWGDKEEVLKNRRAFLNKNGISLKESVLMNVQNHGDDIKIVTEKDRSAGTEDFDTAPMVDAMITSVPGLPLLVLTADCYPVIFFDPIGRCIGLAHAGWKGVHLKIVQKVIESMTVSFGSEPGNIQTVLAPGIKRQSYVMDEVRQWKYPEWEPYLTKLNSGQTSIDLAGYLMEQCLGAGIKKDNLKVTNVDTASDTDYFSHYRAVRSAEEAEGRMITYVAM